MHSIHSLPVHIIIGFNLAFVDLYSGGALGFSSSTRSIKENSGVTGISDDGSGSYLAYQATPLGLRIGKTFSGFFELGYGYKGIVALGLGLRL
jgi:hypothetical protein